MSPCQLVTWPHLICAVKRGQVEKVKGVRMKYKNVGANDSDVLVTGLVQVDALVGTNDGNFMCTTLDDSHIHSDDHGPVDPALVTKEKHKLKGETYTTVFVHDRTGYMYITNSNKKDKEALCDAYAKFTKHMLRLNHKFKVTKFTSDNGGDYVSHMFQSLLKEGGVTFESCCPYTQAQNGKAERAWRTINDLERAQREAKQLNKKFWKHSKRYAVFCWNRTPNKEGITPYEQVTGEKPDIRWIFEFG